MGCVSAATLELIGARTMIDVLTYWWKRAKEAERKLEWLAKQKKENS